MDSLFFGTFNLKRPCIICTESSLVISGNEAASKKLQRLFEKEQLFSFMSPYDILRYEAAISISEPEAFDFQLNSYHGYSWAMALPQRLGGRVLVAVTLYKSRQESAAFMSELKDTESLPSARLYEFVEEFSEIDMPSLDEIERDALFDIKAVTKQLSQDLHGEIEIFDCEIDYSENKQMEDTPCMPSAIGIGNYLKMVISMMYVMNDITNSRRISVRLCRYEDTVDIRMTTDSKQFFSAVSSVNALIETFPSCILRLSLCEFIAVQTGCVLSVSSSREKQSITLSLLSKPKNGEEPDFRSRNQMQGYKKLLKRTVEKLSRL